jgi:hypothetical protein
LIAHTSTVRSKCRSAPALHGSAGVRRPPAHGVTCAGRGTDTMYRERTREVPGSHIDRPQLRRARSV